MNIWENKEQNPSSVVIISHDIREVVFLADRIIMMEPNPGRISFIMENTLPRPRDIINSKNLSILSMSSICLYAGRDGLPVKPITPLLSVNPEEILGFLSYLR